LNIFYIDEDPVKAAQMMVDKHVVKMILESAQLLSTAHRVVDGLPLEVTLAKDGKTRKKKVWVLDDERNDIFYSATHINHPSAIWARQSVENYTWLVDHLFALSNEYTYRYGKKHLTMTKMAFEIQSPPFGVKAWDMTPMPSCMPKELIISNNPVDNYRNYYKYGKANLHKWTKRDAPAWII
jgi:hypothetical protein